jgi:hypothetical protein
MASVPVAIVGWQTLRPASLPAAPLRWSLQMTVSKQQILATLATIEDHAPLFFGDMPVADDVVRDLFASSMVALSESPDYRLATPNCRELAMLATLTHALLETACLHHELYQREQVASREAGCLIAKLATS